MELTYNDLTKLDVINIADGRCLGKITNIKFSFPKGYISGIYVPGRKICPLLKIFNKTELYIDEKNIKKIGGDVILVDLKCGETCAPNSANKHKCDCGNIYPEPPFMPPCTPPCPPPQSSPFHSDGSFNGVNNCDDKGNDYINNGRIDMEDYN